MWRLRSKLCRAAAVVLFANFILFFAKEPEGAEYALSGFALPEAGAVTADTSRVQVLYLLGGGIQNSFNQTSYAVGSGNHLLYTPYRSGFRFIGWYEDAGFHKRVLSVPTDEKERYVLYARWTVKIDNEQNVENYTYQQKTKDTGNVRLKDLDYRFYEEIDIPGMPDTRENDLLKNYIFSESQCPQGLCLTDEFVLITSYSTEDDLMGELMVFDRETGEYRITLGMDENSHLGGIAFDGDNIWVCNSYENCVERISYDFIELMANRNAGEVVDARAVVDTYEVDNTPSCITYYGGRLWIATHTLLVNSQMVAYYFDKTTGELTALSEYAIPAKVQGLAFDEDGGVYVSTSYGRSASSYLYYYTSVTELATHPKRSALSVEMPPCSEELDVSGGTLYVLFESAGEKYLEGTDGKGKSACPLDKILMLSVAELSENAAD